jgi:hypothetical protein
LCPRGDPTHTMRRSEAVGRSAASRAVAHIAIPPHPQSSPYSGSVTERPISKRRVVTATAVLRLAASESGGLPHPLQVPTQSVVFRFMEGALAGQGIVAIVDLVGDTELQPGTTTSVRVILPDAPHDTEFADQSFELWLGHSLGTAEIIAVESDKMSEA